MGLLLCVPTVSAKLAHPAPFVGILPHKPLSWPIIWLLLPLLLSAWLFFSCLGISHSFCLSFLASDSLVFVYFLASCNDICFTWNNMYGILRLFVLGIIHDIDTQCILLTLWWHIQYTYYVYCTLAYVLYYWLLNYCAISHSFSLALFYITFVNYSVLY